MTRVVNRHVEAFDVYIGRGTPFGNRFRIGPDGDREECVSRFEAEFLAKIKADPSFRRAVEALKDKVLGCSCKPLRCHGDVIVAWLEGARTGKED